MGLEFVLHMKMSFVQLLGKNYFFFKYLMAHIIFRIAAVISIIDLKILKNIDK